VDLVVIPGGYGHIDGFIDRGGHDESIIIVGMFPDEIDPARGSDNQGIGAEFLSKSFFYLLAEGRFWLDSYHNQVNLQLSK
jgi:hypothetical protein